MKGWEVAWRRRWGGCSVGRGLVRRAWTRWWTRGYCWSLSGSAGKGSPGRQERFQQADTKTNMQSQIHTTEYTTGIWDTAGSINTHKISLSH